MTAKPHSLHCRIRWVRRSLRRRHDSLSPRARERIVLAALILLMLLYGWFLFREEAGLRIDSIEFPHLKP